MRALLVNNCRFADCFFKNVIFRCNKSSLIDEKLDVAVNHSALHTLPGPSSIVFVFQPCRIVVIERMKFYWLRNKHRCHVKFSRDIFELSMSEVPYLLHLISVNVCICNHVFVDYINAIVTIEFKMITREVSNVLSAFNLIVKEWIIDLVHIVKERL